MFLGPGAPAIMHNIARRNENVINNCSPSDGVVIILLLLFICLLILFFLIIVD